MSIQIRDNVNYLGVSFQTVEGELHLTVPIFLVNGEPSSCFTERLGIIVRKGKEYHWKKFSSRNFQDYERTEISGVESDLRDAMSKLVSALPSHVDRNRVTIKLLKMERS